MVAMSRKKKRNYYSDSEGLQIPELNPETKRGIAVIFLFAAAVLLFLAFFQIAGTIGLALDGLMAKGFGVDRILIPFLFVVIGFSLLFPERSKMAVWNYIGLLFFFLSFNGLINLFWNDGPNTSIETLMKTGGLAGQILGNGLFRVAGFWGTLAILPALLLVSVLLTLNTSLRQVVGLHRHLTGWFGARLHDRRVAVLAREMEANDFAEEEETEEDEAVFEEAEEANEEESKKKFRASAVAPTAAPPVEKVLTAKQHRKINLPIDLLEYRSMKVNSGDTERNKEIIRRTFEQFHIPVEMGEIAIGPTIAQYTMRPAEGVKLSKIVALNNDLALALAAHPIRIEAPIPGKSLVGVEVPNQSIATVSLRELLESKAFKSRSTNLTVAIGKDVAGKVWVAPIEKMPHMLIAGATGSGKSVCINTIIVSLLYNNGPDELKMIVVDPKRVELTNYEGIPHLLIPPITKVEDTVNALKWTVREMERRLDVLSKFGARDINSYNQRVEEKMPRIVVLIDELADLMSSSGHEVEGAIVRIAQMARAVGIHLILATQRPSVDVITGLIKANIPTRVAFAVASQTDSRTILDCAGAEKLLGRGDMLYSSAELSKPVRLQGAYVSESEIEKIVGFLKREEAPDYNYAVLEKEKMGSIFDGAVDTGDSDPMLVEAAQIVIQAGRASTSLLQRRLKIGYGRAARILDILEENGVIGPPDGSRPREILVDSWPPSGSGLNDPEFAERRELSEIEDEVAMAISEIENEDTEEAIEEESDNGPDVSNNTPWGDGLKNEQDFLNAQEGEYLDEK